MKTKKQNAADKAVQTKVCIPAGDGHYTIDIKKLEDPLYIISGIFDHGTDIDNMFERLCQTTTWYMRQQHELAKVRKNMPDGLDSMFFEMRDVAENNIQMCRLFAACAMIVSAFEHQPELL